MVLSKKTSQEGYKNTFLGCFRFLHRIYFGKLEISLASHQETSAEVPFHNITLSLKAFYKNCLHRLPQMAL